MIRMKTTHRLILFLCCIAISITGIYLPNKDADSFFSYTNTKHTMSTVSGYDKKIDVIDEKNDSVLSENRAKLSSSIRNAISTGNNSKIIYSLAALLIIALFVWAIINVLLRNEFIDRFYLIMYIHNSDGEKGDRQAFLGHNKN